MTLEKTSPGKKKNQKKKPKKPKKTKNQTNKNKNKAENHNTNTQVKTRGESMHVRKPNRTDQLNAELETTETQPTINQIAS